MHRKQFITRGKNWEEATHAMVMLHGRGANAEDILSLTDYFDVKNFLLLAPQATNNTWYPYSFMAPPAQNEPWLSSAITLLADIISDIKSHSIPAANIYLLGFSQGACLALEFAARNADRYGGVAAFTGGLIGDKIYPENYKGDFAGTPVFIGTSDPYPHVPVARVHESATIFENMNAIVTKKIYKHLGHTINQDEIDTVNQVLFKKV